VSLAKTGPQPEQSPCNGRGVGKHHLEFAMRKHRNWSRRHRPPGPEPAEGRRTSGGHSQAVRKVCRGTSRAQNDAETVPVKVGLAGTRPLGALLMLGLKTGYALALSSGLARPCAGQPL
jgi:hypothetical protein